MSVSTCTNTEIAFFNAFFVKIQPNIWCLVSAHTPPWGIVLLYTTFNMGMTVIWDAPPQNTRFLKCSMWEYICYSDQLSGVQQQKYWLSVPTVFFHICTPLMSPLCVLFKVHKERCVSPLVKMCNASNQRSTNSSYLLTASGFLKSLNSFISCQALFGFWWAKFKAAKYVIHKWVVIYLKLERRNPFL